MIDEWSKQPTVRREASGHRVVSFTEGEPRTIVGGVNVKELYRKEQPSLTHYVKTYFGDMDDHEAADAVQVAFARLLQRLNSGDPPREPVAWLRKVAINAYRESSRRFPSRRRSMAEVPHAPDDLPAGSVQSAAYEAEISDDDQSMRKLIASLPEKQRWVMLGVYNDMSAEEIAEQLDMTVVAVRKNLSRARKAIEKHFPESGRSAS